MLQLGYAEDRTSCRVVSKDRDRRTKKLVCSFFCVEADAGEQ